MSISDPPILRSSTRGAPCVAASPFYSAESLASRRTGRAQNTPLYAFRPASRRRRARDVGVVALTSSNHDSPPSDRLQIQWFRNAANSLCDLVCFRDFVECTAG